MSNGDRLFVLSIASLVIAITYSQHGDYVIWLFFLIVSLIFSKMTKDSDRGETGR